MDSFEERDLENVDLASCRFLHVQRRLQFFPLRHQRDLLGKQYRPSHADGQNDLATRPQRGIGNGPVREELIQSQNVRRRT